MATVTKPIALDESFHTTEQNPRNIADVLLEGFSHITGRTASEVEYDNTESGLTADNVQDALDEIVEDIPTVPSVDIQTAVDEFETYNGGLLSSLKVSLSPNQDLHGYDSPWVGGANVNKFPSAVAESKTVNGVTVVSDGHGTYSLSGIASADAIIDFDIEQAYTIPQSIGNGGQGCCYFFNNKTYSGGEFLFYFMDGTREVDSWSMADLNRINSTYSAMSGQTCNKVRFKVVSGTNVDGLKISPMFSENGLTTNPFTWWENICPISGHTQVDVGDDGKNLCDPTVIPLNGLGGDHYVATTLPVGSVVARIKGGKTYTVSIKNAQTIFTSTCKNYPTVDAPMVDNYAGSGGLSVTSKTITTSVGANYLVVNTGSNNYEEIQIEEGSTATPYVPYNGYQVTVNLGGTYYSGTLDVVSGVLTVVGESVKGSSITWIDATAGGYQRFRSNATLANAESNELTTDLLKCSKFDTNRNALDALDADGICIYGKYIYVRSKTTTSLAEFQTLIADADICYTYATPTPIQLSPTMVKALVGENHLSAPLDGQEITESKYRELFTWDEVQKYVEGFDHNSMFRGKCLGTSVTAEQYAEIANGTFRDMYIGDYWYINDIRWRIADFDYWFGTGDVACTTHHIVIVPDSYLSTYRFNATNDTTGGYLGSELYTTNMTYAKNHVNNAFGSAHVLSHRDFYSNAVADGHASAGTWVDSDVDLMSEQMVYGSSVCSYEGRLFEIGVDKSQLSLFRLKQSHARRSYSYWLRGIRNAERFAIAGSYGLPDSDSASVSYRIRPCFGLKG